MLNFFCLKNASTGWRTQQGGATQVYNKQGSRGKDFFDFSRINPLTPLLDHISHVFKVI